MEFTPVQKNVVSLLLCSLSLPLTVGLWGSPALLIIALLSLSVAVFAIRADRESIVIYLLGGFAGPLAEAAAISSGAWTYSNPDILGVPYWLFPLWVLASIFIWSKGLLIQYLIDRKQN